MKKIIFFLIHIYQTVSRYILPARCRFYPSCSEYMEIAIEKFGILQGLFLGMKRLFRCHPFHPGGHDPIP